MTSGLEIVLVVRYSPRRCIHVFFNCNKYTDIRSNLLTHINRQGATTDLVLITRGIQNKNWL